MGKLLITRPAHLALDEHDVQVALLRHAKGDWGDLDEHDLHVNEDALLYGSRLLSAYKDRFETKFWIITEADRSATTILLPSDY